LIINRSLVFLLHTDGGQGKKEHKKTKSTVQKKGRRAQGAREGKIKGGRARRENREQRPPPLQQRNWVL
jgi:hypothetical protein